MRELIEEAMMNIGIITSTFIVIPILLDRALYTFAKVTYEFAHKK